jgi:hypothetical protein
LTATRSIIVPTADKVYLIKNGTSGSQSILVTTSGGTGITIKNGEKRFVYCDGTNVVESITAMASLVLDTPLAIAEGGTGSTSAAGTLAAISAQAQHDILDDLSGVTQATDKLPYFSSSSAMTTASFTTFARTILDDADASAVRTTLGLGTLSTKSTVASADITNGTIEGVDIASGVALAGDPTTTTQTSTDSSTKIATTAFVQAQKASVALTGTPTSTTAAGGTNTTQIATTAFVQSAVDTDVSTHAGLRPSSTVYGHAKIYTSGGNLYIVTT